MTSYCIKPGSTFVQTLCIGVQCAVTKVCFVELSSCTYRQEPHFASTYRFRDTSHINDRCDVLRWVTGGRFVLFVLLFVFVVLLSEPLSLSTPGSPRVSDLINWPHVMLFFGWSPMHYVENTLPEDGVESTISYKTETHVWVNCNHCHDNKGWDLW